MAARKNRGVNNLPEDWKNKIKATAIMNRLADCVNGEIELTSQQIKAADIILRKIIPDLARTELTGDKDKPVAVADVSDVKSKILKAIPDDQLASILDTGNNNG